MHEAGEADAETTAKGTLVSLWWQAMRIYIEPLLAVAVVFVVAVVLARIVTGTNRGL